MNDRGNSPMRWWVLALPKADIGAPESGRDIRDDVFFFLLNLVPLSSAVLSHRRSGEVILTAGEMHDQSHQRHCPDDDRTRG